ncbi:MAG: dephospho-CoA kinase [Coriobacteriales bacterium]|nr:dephospho-CoA kinase [Coriobacteriales bacterium]
MYIVFVTGGIGSGKTSVCELLGKKGAHLYSLDEVSHNVLQDEEVKNELVRAFGDQVVSLGTVNRKALAQAAFANPSATQTLNDIMHPRIRARLLGIIEHENKMWKDEFPQVLVIEVPLIEATGPNNDFADEIIAVSCPVDKRRERAVMRGMNEQDFDARVLAQITDTERSRYARTLFDNSQDEAHLQSQIDAWWETRFGNNS